MRALITGCSGFVGQAMAKRLASRHWEIFGLDQHKIQDTFPVYVGDIQNQAFLEDVIQATKPNVIFHFAGIIKAETTFEYFNINTLGTLSVFNALSKSGIKPKILIASSSSVYGSGVGKKPISEKFSLSPLTDYATSKVAQEYVANSYFYSNKIPIFITRTFNLIGPGQSPQLACSAFARQIAIQESATSPQPIKTGNLNNYRDFVDIRDAVEAYEMVILHGKAGAVYNVCTGRSIQLKECLNILLGMAKQPLQTVVEVTKKQNMDIPIQVGNNHFIKESLHWQPKIGIHDSLADLLNYWRNEINKQN